MDKSDIILKYINNFQEQNKTEHKELRNLITNNSIKSITKKDIIFFASICGSILLNITGS